MRKENFPLPSMLALGVLTVASLAGCSDAGRSWNAQPLFTSGTGGAARRVLSSGSLYISSLSAKPNGGVAVYSGTPLKYARTITEGIDLPDGIAFNSKRQLFVANQNAQTVTVYKSNGENPIRTLSNKFMKSPFQVAISSHNDLYVLARHFVNIYINARLPGVKKIRLNAGAIAIDALNNVYIPVGDGVIDVFAPRGTKPIRTISTGLDGLTDVAIDAAGNLYVGSAPGSQCGSIAVYNAAKGTLENTITNGVCTPGYISFDSEDNVYVSNLAHAGSGPASVTVYAAGTNALLETITNGISDPGETVVDTSGNLYVANVGFPGSVTVYPTNQTMPSETLTDGINYPNGLAWLPKL
jgi:hypothetical protein